MKNLILIFATVLSFNATLSASNIGEGEIKIIDAAKISVVLDNEGQKDFILFSEFNVEDEKVEFVFESNVSMIQVYNMDGDLEMMLPIMSKEVSLGLSLFESGNYRMGFMVDGMNDVQFTNLSVK